MPKYPCLSEPKITCIFQYPEESNINIQVSLSSVREVWQGHTFQQEDKRLPVRSTGQLQVDVPEQGF